MLETGFVWLLLFLFSYVFGGTIVELFNRSRKGEAGSVLLCVLTGFTFILIYAQSFSLFHPVDEWALLGLSVLWLCGVFYYRKYFMQKLRCLLERIKGLAQCDKGIVCCTAIALALIYSYLFVMSVQPVTHYDTYLYQAQAVRWIEDYGCVKGIANISSRMGFNSSILSVHALFGMKWLFGRSLHGVNSFLAVVLATEAVCGLARFKKHSYHMADILRALSLIYILSNHNFINSLATDFPNMILTAAVLIIWIGISEEEKEDFLTYEILCLIIVGIVTIKFSSLFLLVLAYVPAKEIWRKKDWKAAVGLVLLGVGIALPFLIRNYFISGWLLYPFAGIDLFDVPWKLPEELVVSEANWVYSWARIPWEGFEKTLEGPFMFWFGTWWHNQRTIIKMTFALIVVLLPCVAIMYLKNGKKRKTRYANFLLMLAISFIYWIVTAPDVRFSWIYIMMLPYACVLSAVYDGKFLCGKERIKKLLFCGMGIFLCIQAAAFFKSNHGGGFLIRAFHEVGANRRLLVCQQDYDRPDVESYCGNGFRIVYPVEGDQTGYWDIPGAVSLEKAKRVALLGETFEEGFRTIDL